MKRQFPGDGPPRFNNNDPRMMGRGGPPPPFHRGGGGGGGRFPPPGRGGGRNFDMGGRGRGGGRFDMGRGGPMGPPSRGGGGPMMMNGGGGPGGGGRGFHPPGDRMMGGRGPPMNMNHGGRGAGPGRNFQNLHPNDHHRMRGPPPPGRGPMMSPPPPGMMMGRGGGPPSGPGGMMRSPQPPPGGNMNMGRMNHQHQQQPPFPPPQSVGPPPTHSGFAPPHHQQPHHHPQYPTQQQQQQQPPNNPAAFPQQQLQHAAYPKSTGPPGLTAQASTVVHAHQPQTAAVQGWKEYTGPNGVKYYHNAITKESTYDKPAALMIQSETASVAATATTSTTPKAIWHEYTEPTSGKKYYSNGVTTTWEKPADFSSTDEPAADTTISDEPATKKKKTSDSSTVAFSSKDEAIAAFKGFLLAKDISPTIKWNEVVKQCSSDTRWKACEDVLSIGERRQALAEYQTKRANELRDMERQERVRAKEAFGHLLTELLPSIKTFSAWGSKFQDVRPALSKDDRFFAVQDEGTRESLFLEFCEEFRKRDERKKRNKKRAAQDAFMSFLKEKEETGALTFASTWDSFLSSLSDEEKQDERFRTSPEMPDSEQQVAFADFVIELQAAEDDKRKRIRDARRRAEKAQREAYRDLLQKLAEEGTILPSTRWNDVEDIMTRDSAYKAMLAQGPEAPREMFDDFVDEWDVIFRRERSLLSRLLRPPTKNHILITQDMTYEDFTKIVLDHASNSSQHYNEAMRIMNSQEFVPSSRLFYNELIQLAKKGVAPPGSRDRADSSEDEGEIKEDGELPDEDAELRESVHPSTEPEKRVQPTKTDDESNIRAKKDKESSTENSTPAPEKAVAGVPQNSDDRTVKTLDEASTESQGGIEGGDQQPADTSKAVDEPAATASPTRKRRKKETKSTAPATRRSTRSHSKKSNR